MDKTFEMFWTSNDYKFHPSRRSKIRSSSTKDIEAQRSLQKLKISDVKQAQRSLPSFNDYSEQIQEVLNTDK